MATFLFRSTQTYDKNANGIQAVLVSAATEGLARQLMAELTPCGARVPESWPAVQLTADDLPASLIPSGQQPIILFEGNAICPGELTRGGSRHHVPIL